MGDITSFGTSTLKSFCNIAIGKIDYFEVTRPSEFQLKLWLILQKAGPLNIVSS